MTIIINAASIYKGGAEQVVNSFINECRGIPGNEYHIFLCDNILKPLNQKNFDPNFHFYRFEKRPASTIYNLIKTVQRFNNLEQEIKPDFVISTGGHGFWIPQSPLITGFNIPHYVYPESPYFNKISLKKEAYWKLRKQFDLFFYRRSDAIVTQTDDVNKRVKKLMPNVQVETVSNTVNGVFLDPPISENKLPPQKEDEVRLLTVSSNYPHKNLDIILDVVDKLLDAGKTNIKFVLTLPDEAFEKFEDDKYQQNIINVGPVPIDECPALYNECDMMFLPTLLECFSASYVEAMAMKKPILTSNLGFAHSICGDAAIYFDPLDGGEIADKIINLIENENIQNKLIKVGSNIFDAINSPKERAERFLSVGNKLVKENTNITTY